MFVDIIYTTIESMFASDKISESHITLIYLGSVIPSSTTCKPEVLDKPEVRCICWIKVGGAARITRKSKQ